MAAKKLLYIDPQCPPGHASFNGIWIKALAESGTFDVTLAFPAEYERRLDYDRRKCRFLEIPPSWIPTPGGKNRGPLARLLLRFRRIARLRKMLAFLRPQDYDLVLLSSFDTPVAFFSPMQSHFVWVGHNLAEQVDRHAVSRIMLRRIGAKSHLVALGPYTAEKLQECGVRNVLEIPLGFPPPFRVAGEPPPGMSREIFAPCKTHCDRKTLDALLSDAMDAVLDETGAKLVLRVGRGTGKHVRVLEGRIPDDEYAMRMTSSMAILLFYQDGYERNSLILREAMVSGRPVLMRRLPFYAHLEGTPGLRFFSTREELEAQIRNLASSPACPDYGAVLREENPQRIPEVLETVVREDA